MNLHEAQQEALRTKQHASLTIYWPGLDNDIDNIILNCQQCQDHVLQIANHPEISFFIDLTVYSIFLLLWG